jgi:hypothetical protein
MQRISTDDPSASTVSAISAGNSTAKVKPLASQSSVATTLFGYGVSSQTFNLRLREYVWHFYIHLKEFVQRELLKRIRKNPI